jgi:hypothetical protein
LKQAKEPWIDRKSLETLLAVSTTVAWRVLKRCGARSGPGNSLAIAREDLIDALEAMVGGAAAPEIARRQRLADRIELVAAGHRAERVQVAAAGEAQAVVNTRFARLPEGVSLEPRRLTVEFRDFDQFMQQIGAVVYALQNDWEALREYIGAAPEDSMPV